MISLPLLLELGVILALFVGVIAVLAIPAAQGIHR